LKSRMPERRSILAFLVAVALFAGGSAALEAQLQENYTYTLGVLGGIGGALDADIDPGLGEPSLMIVAAMVTEARTLVGIRAGRLKIEDDEGFEEFLGAELEYLNISGEYRFSQGFYDYGVYLGVGYYQLSGELRVGGDHDESDLGGVVGFTGDFDITPHISIVGDLSVHYVWVDAASIYGMANIGVAFHF
jgi:hypothetical protein